MKRAIQLILITLLAGVGCAIAQFVNEHNPPNWMGRAEIRAVASRLAVGMREEDAVTLLATNGVRVNGAIQDTNGWARVCCYTNATHVIVAGLWLHFRQKPSPSGPTRTERGLVEMTNGVLYRADLEGVQIARTNGP